MYSRRGESGEKKNFELCNFSFNEDCKNIPNLSVLMRKMPCNFNKQRAPQVVLKLKTSHCTYNKFETPISIIISQKKKGKEHLIKNIGANNVWKVILGTQLEHEYMCDMRNPNTRRLVFWDIKKSTLRIVNSILKWNDVKNIKDFDVMQRELKNRVKFYGTKFPQLIIPSIKNRCHFNFSCNLSHNGVGTASNLQNYGHVTYIKNYVNKLISDVNKGTEENVYIGKSFSHEYNDYIHDKRQFYNCLISRDSKPNFYISKVKFYMPRYIYYVSAESVFKLGSFPSLDFTKRNTQNYFRQYPGQFEHLAIIYGLRGEPFSLREIAEADN